MIINRIQENIVLQLSDWITGQSVRNKLTFLMKSQFWTREQLDIYQNERLQKLIEHAYASVPYYRDYMHEHNLTPTDIQTKDDLVKLPIVNKEIIRKEGIARFTSEAYPASKRIVISSSGSTGQPFVHYITKEDYSMDIAANLREWYNIGWRLGDKYIKISQNPRKNLIKKIQDWVTRNKYVATDDLSDEHLLEIMKEIECYKPKVIRSYPDPLYIMAQYRLNHPEFTYHPLAITTTGNTLHTHVRKLIEKAFGCPIFDSYASEGNAVEFECSTHECYHVADEYGITEVLDEDNQPVIDGQGRVVTTDLWNYAHPFIRYDVQDRVVVSSMPCSCGRAHKRIDRIMGRDNEVLQAPSGRRYIVHHFTVFFEPTVTPELKDSIEQFQIVQHKDGTTTIKIVVNEKYDISVREYLEKYWTNEFGAIVHVENVDKIPIMENNKRRFILIEK